MDCSEALALARRAGRLFVKAGREGRRFDAGHAPISEREALSYLVHEDGLLRVPVLVSGDLLVRGFTEELYDQALGSGAEAPGRTGEEPGQ